METPQKCATLTVRKERKRFLEAQLAKTSLLVLRIMYQMYHTDSIVPARARAMGVRHVIVKHLRSKGDAYQVFYASVTDKYPHAGSLVQLLGSCQVDLLELDQFIHRSSAGHLIREPLLQLYNFCLSFLYEYPGVLRSEDGIGDHIGRFREALLDRFIMESVEVTFPKLDADYLEHHLEDLPASAVTANSIPQPDEEKNLPPLQVELFR